MAFDSKPAKIFRDAGSQYGPDALQKIINSTGLYNRNQLEFYSKFNRFGILDPYTAVTTTREYLFFTKPDLHIFESKSGAALNPEIANIPIFQNAMERYSPVLKQLQYSVTGDGGPFINLLSNTVKSSLDLPGIQALETETSSNIYGTNLTYRRESVQSDESYDFSLEFEDTKYLEVYMFFRLFDEYERLKYYGAITPPDMNYRYRKILHDQISIFKFIVGEDGESLIYWSKYYGCYPKTVPRDAFSDMTASGGLRFTIQWKGQFVDDMDPQILNDFNILVKDAYSKGSELPLYNTTLGIPEGDWAGTPYIGVDNGTSSLGNGIPLAKNMQYKYKLKWRT